MKLHTFFLANLTLGYALQYPSSTNGNAPYHSFLRPLPQTIALRTLHGPRTIFRQALVRIFYPLRIFLVTIWTLEC